MSEQLFTPSVKLTFDWVKGDVQRLQALLKDPRTSGIRMDLSHVSQCDSAGLALLIEAKRMCGNYKKSLNVVGIPKSISMLAQFCGVEGMLEREQHHG